MPRLNPSWGVSVRVRVSLVTSEGTDTGKLMPGDHLGLPLRRSSFCCQGRSRVQEGDGDGVECRVPKGTTTGFSDCEGAHAIFAFCVCNDGFGSAACCDTTDHVRALPLSALLPGITVLSARKLRPFSATLIRWIFPPIPSLSGVASHRDGRCRGPAFTAHIRS